MKHKHDFNDMDKQLLIVIGNFVTLWVLYGYPALTIDLLGCFEFLMADTK